MCNSEGEKETALMRIQPDSRIALIKWEKACVPLMNADMLRNA